MGCHFKLFGLSTARDWVVLYPWAVILQMEACDPEQLIQEQLFWLHPAWAIGTEPVFWKARTSCNSAAGVFLLNLSAPAQIVSVKYIGQAVRIWFLTLTCSTQRGTVWVSFSTCCLAVITVWIGNCRSPSEISLIIPFEGELYRENVRQEPERRSLAPPGCEKCKGRLFCSRQLGLGVLLESARLVAFLGGSSCVKQPSYVEHLFHY